MENATAHAREDNVRFSISVPANSLSFADYLRGSRLTRSAMAERRRLGRLPLFIITVFVAWLLLAFLVSFYNGKYQLRIIGWASDGQKDDYLFFLYNTEALSLLVACYIAGAVMVRISATRHLKRWARLLYTTNDAIRHGYLLELTDRGIKCIHADNCSTLFLAWSKVTALHSGDNHDYIIMGASGFLWIPVTLPDYPREEISAFIKQHL